MPESKFRLESVLKYRNMELNNQRLILAEFQTELNRQTTLMTELQKRQSELNAFLTQLYSAAVISPEELNAQQRYLDQTQREIHALNDSILRLQNKIDLQQEKVVEANQEVKKMEKLKEQSE